MSSKMIKPNTVIILIIAIYAFLSAPHIVAQEIEATVSLNTEGMPSEYLQNIESFQATLERYINTQKFSNMEWEGPKIPVNISIQLKAVKNTKNYSANLFITSKRTINEKDNTQSVAMMFEDQGKWNFEYSNGLSLSYDFNRYDNISSLIDFYMLIIIGLDLDSYGELDGDQCYRRAKQIFDLAVTRNIDGWESYSQDYGRKTLISDLTNPRLDVFRRLIFAYYVDGIDLISGNKEEALKSIAGTVHEIANFKEHFMNPSHLMASFFATKCQELCELFKGYKADPKVFRDLMFLDPANTTRYEAARDNK